MAVFCCIIVEFPEIVVVLMFNTNRVLQCYLEQILSTGVHPRFIHVEVHSLVPPPIVFRPNTVDRSVPSGTSPMDLLEFGAHQQYSYRLGHMLPYCSLSAYVELLEPFGYELLNIEWHDATFVSYQTATELRKRGELAPRSGHVVSPLEVEEMWLRGFYCHAARRLGYETAYEMTFLYDYRRWNDPETPLKERLTLIRDYLSFWGEPRAYTLRLYESRI